MQTINQKPFPAEGPWHHVSQAFGAYWMKDSAKGDQAMMALQQLKAEETITTSSGAENGFHWQVYQISRVVELFGGNGVLAPHRMGLDAEKAAKLLIWQWLEPRAGMALVEPSKDWWLWGSENHHLQSWFSMWSALNLLARDPDYQKRTFADGSTVPQLKSAFDDYFKRWIRNRATRGLFVECGSPTYEKYSLGGFYNLVDFSNDQELRRLAKEFLDLNWAQWALEEVNGVRAGSRHRSYPGVSSIVEGGGDELAWYHFGIGKGSSVHPGVLCTATSSYVPPPLVTKIAEKRPELGRYEITSRQPGLLDPAFSGESNFVTNPNHPFYIKKGVFTLDSLCRSMLRKTYATPEFILGTTMVPPLTESAWSAISSQNRWDGVVFSGAGSPRIFIQPKPLKKGSIYNAQWSVQSKGILIAQRLPFSNAKSQRVWLSSSLKQEEKDGWIFVEAPEAYAALKVADGGWAWEKDSADYWHDPKSFKSGLGRWLIPEKELSPVILEVVPKDAYPDFKTFQKQIVRNTLVRADDRIDYTSDYYQTTVTLFTDFQKLPCIDKETVDFQPSASFAGGILESAFGGNQVKLHAFDQEHIFQF